MSFNPYEAPQTCCRVVAGGPSREEFAMAMETTFVDPEVVEQFDRMVIAGLRADDTAIRFVATEISSFFCEDGVTEWTDLSKAEWDYFQRLILVLRSNCDVEMQSRYRWGFIGAASAVATVVSAGFLLKFGMIVYPIVSGIAALCIVTYWMLEKDRPGTTDEPIYPFANYAELSQAYRSTPFRKRRYPSPTLLRGCSSFWDFVFIFFLSAILLVGAPLAILIASVPWLKTTGRARLPILTSA